MPFVREAAQTLGPRSFDPKSPKLGNNPGKNRYSSKVAIVVTIVVRVIIVIIRE